MRIFKALILNSLRFHSHYWGRLDCSAYTETYTEQWISSKTGIIKIIFDPFVLLIIVFIKFDPLTASWDGFISQDVKIYLALSETKRNRIPLSLRLSGIR